MKISKFFLFLVVFVLLLNVTLLAFMCYWIMVDSDMILHLKNLSE